MRILFNIGHPAQVHLFKNLIWNLEKKGHKCNITTINKDVSLKLLNNYGFNYEIVGSAKSSLFLKAIELIKIEFNLYKIAKSFKPDILIGGVGNAYVTHVGKLINKPSIVFDDTEHAKIEHFLLDPFADVICTPSCFIKNLGKKQVRYNGYHELAYLHPNYFTPNPAILDEMGLSKDDIFIIMRFVSWSAIHDAGHIGLTFETISKAVKEFEKYGRVYITSESQLPNEFVKYRLKILPEKIHDLMYYATLLYGESATMASECAVLGTHAIFSDFAGRGYTNEEEEKYGLVYNFKLDASSQQKSILKALELLEVKELRQEGKKKREKMLNDKIDVTAYMIKLIENYPEISG